MDVEFLNKKGDKYHEALGKKSPYNEKTACFESPPPPAPPPEPETSADDALRLALEEYNATAEDKYKLNITCCTLNDVLLEIIETDGKYNEKGKGFINSPRQLGRSVGDFADAISPWLDLIPSDHGLSFLSAGLKAILDIAKKNAENRQKILQAFREIPDMIFQTKQQQTVFSAVPTLKEQAIALYKVLAHSLAHLIATLNPSKSKHKFREQAIRLRRKFIPYHTASGIDQILENVKTSVHKFSEALQLIRDKYLVETHDNSNTLVDQGNHIKASTEHIEDDIGHLREEVTELKAIIREYQSMRAEQQDTHKDEVDSKNGFLVFVRSDPPEAAIPPMQYITQPPHPQPFLSDIELFNALGVRPNIPIQDVDQVLKHLNHFDPPAQAQAQQLLSSEEFMAWIKSSRPETLYVKGNFQISGPARISALSTLCATLSLNLSKNTNFIVLNFFCGLHEMSGDSNSGPNGLIRSLITQLLLSGVTFNMDFITRTLAEGIKSHDLHDMCSTFRQLIEQLPRAATIICIIDGITRFESGVWQTDLVDVLYILNQIVLNEVLQPTLKLLITTPFVNTRYIDVPGTFWAHYSVVLQPTTVGCGPRMNERGLLQGRSLGEYRARMDSYESDEPSSDDDDDDDLFF